MCLLQLDALRKCIWQIHERILVMVIRRLCIKSQTQAFPSDKPRIHHTTSISVTLTAGIPETIANLTAAPTPEASAS